MSSEAYEEEMQCPLQTRRLSQRRTVQVEALPKQEAAQGGVARGPAALTAVTGCVGCVLASTLSMAN